MLAGGGDQQAGSKNRHGCWQSCPPQPGFTQSHHCRARQEKKRRSWRRFRVDSLWGVGPKTASRLAQLGITTIGELAEYPPVELRRIFGKNGQDLATHALGIDDRPVITSHTIKSVSQEVTFSRDTADETTLLTTLNDLCEGCAARLNESRLSGSTIKLKIRWPDFSTVSRQTTLSQPTDQAPHILAAASLLFQRIWKGQAVRLLGVGIGNLGLQPAPVQPVGSSYRRGYIISCRLKIWFPNVSFLAQSLELGGYHPDHPVQRAADPAWSMDIGVIYQCASPGTRQPAAGLYSQPDRPGSGRPGSEHFRLRHPAQKAQLGRYRLKTHSTALDHLGVVDFGCRYPNPQHRCPGNPASPGTCPPGTPS